MTEISNDDRKIEQFVYSRLGMMEFGIRVSWFRLDGGLDWFRLKSVIAHLPTCQPDAAIASSHVPEIRLPLQAGLQCPSASLPYYQTQHLFRVGCYHPPEKQKGCKMTW